MKIDKSKYQSKSDLLAFVKANKTDLIEMKRHQIKFTDAFGTSIFEQKTTKALNTSYQDDPDSGVIKRTIIGNTYNWLDSHDDVHVEGIFTKSINERKDKIWHLHDHLHQITAKVGKPMQIYEKQLHWADLGVSKNAMTTSLFMDSEISKQMNPAIFNDYLKNDINQHSVGMVYVKVEVAMDDEGEKEEFSNWNKYLPILGNPDRAIKQGYFFVIKEAKLIEISAVLEGSNELTPTVSNIPKYSDKSAIEPLVEQKKAIDYNYILTNFKLT
jgi:hypothetical protein